MMEGLEYLPWLRARRLETGREPYDCTTCVAPEQKHAWGCGFVPLAKQVKPGPSVAMAMASRPPTVCPGYSTRLPAVREAAAGAVYLEKGQLGMRYPGHEVTDLAIEAIDTYLIAQAHAEEYGRKRAAEEAKRKGRR